MSSITMWALSVFSLYVTMTFIVASPPAPLVRPPGKADPDAEDMCKKLSIPCVYGSCKNVSSPRCECDQGWKGTACDTCGGRISLTETRGYITDGQSNYTTDTKCTWFLEAPSVDQIIRLRFLHFATECSWDHLYIYDGDSVASPQIAAYSGLVIPSGKRSNVMPEVKLEGYALLHFYSDAAYNMSGFNISYSMEPFSCPLDCSDRGICGPSGVCECEPSWTGDGCQYELCPNNCSWPEGTCNKDGCQCLNGRKGIDCSIPEFAGYWQSLPIDLVPSPRASHKHIRDGRYMYVFFGYDFNNDPKDSVTRLNMDTLKWEIMLPLKLQEARQLPTPRYGQSVALHEVQHRVYMFGGLLLDNNNISSELWEYSLDDHTWKPVKVSGFPLPVVGHTAHIVKDVMFVFFGHNPTFGYLNNIQIYNFTDNKWQVTYGQGALVKGGYGHSSVWDPIHQLIYLHAGYVSTTSSTYSLTDALYVFDPSTKRWSVKTGSGHPKFLHAAVYLNEMMYVFGGNTHNDTNISQGAKCYSTNFLAYDPKCDKWMALDPPVLHSDISRFGHVAEVYKDEMYIFGGFNGQVLNDLYKYTPANCPSFKTRLDCLYNSNAVICAWDEVLQCMSGTEAKRRLDTRSNGQTEVHVCEPISTEKAREQCHRRTLCSTCVDSDCLWCDGACIHEGEQTPDHCRDKPAIVSHNDCITSYSVNGTICPTIHNCKACKNEEMCEWSSKSTSCVPNIRDMLHGGAPPKECPRFSKLDCHMRHNCKSCQNHFFCVWNKMASGIYQCQSFFDVPKDDDYNHGYGSNKEPKEATICNQPCHEYSSCDNCTASACMWCGNQKRCVESISYVASFPYGQCMEWTTHPNKCPDTYCAGLRTCDACHNSPACGWCDDGSNTGLGQCMEGSLTGPISNTATAKCPSERWSFKHCPACQCNGHSQCHNGTDVCMDCQDHTTGSQCQTCIDGYFGTATNGGNCSVCDCNGQADTCHPESGKCYCHTRGVKGDKCDYCDEHNKYYGDPKNGGTCYYNLNTNYKFTFNLSEGKEESKYQTHINFRNEPPESDRDVDFSINCSDKAMMNITMVSKETDGEEVPLYTDKPCTVFEEQFSHNEFVFGGDSNTTFYVYVYDFKTPFIVEISFAQDFDPPLLKFMAVFLSCFLSLLLIAAVVWKVKQKCDLYRRRQRMVVEMEQMASRPFSTCNVDLPSTVEEPLLRQEYITNMATIRSSQRYKKGAPNGYSPSPITLEPLSGNKAAVLSLLIRLPTGDEEYAPSGQQGLAVGSAMVTIGNYRKNSTDSSRPDKNIKPRKPLSPDTGIPENCV